MALKNRNSFFVVALTATPPYDSSRSELTKYFKLCGEVDDEIAVPDLVKANDLCPHQDFVYFSKPNDLEQYKLEILGFYKDEVIQFPKLNLEWLQILLQNLLVIDRETLITIKLCYSNRLYPKGIFKN